MTPQATGGRELWDGCDDCDAEIGIGAQCYIDDKHGLLCKSCGESTKHARCPIR